MLTKITGAILGLAATRNFDTVAEMTAAQGVVIGQKVRCGARADALFTYTAGVSGQNGLEIIQEDSAVNSFVLNDSDITLNVLKIGLIEGTSQSGAVRINNSAAINRALVLSLEIITPPGIYELDGGIIQRRDYSNIICTGAQWNVYHNDAPGLEVGLQGDNRIFNAKHKGVFVRYLGGAATAQIGVRYLQCFQCDFSAVSAINFQFSSTVESDFTAAFYSTYDFTMLENAEILFQLIATTTGATGFINANTIYIHRAQTFTVTGIKTGGDTASNVTGDNVFFHPVIENSVGATHGIDEGGANYYIQPRIEGSFSVIEVEFNSDSVRASIESDSFFLANGLGFLDNGTQSRVRFVDYKQDTNNTLSGINEIFNRGGSTSDINIRTSSVQWTLSGTGTDIYYLEAAGGGRPPRLIPPYATSVKENNSQMTFNNDISTLVVGEWGQGDQDSLGYKAFYVRLSDGADPDSKASGFVELTGASAKYWLESPFSANGSQMLTVAQRVESTNAHVLRVVDFDTGEVISMIDAGGSFCFKDGRPVPAVREGLVSLYFPSSGADPKIIYPNGTIKTFTMI